MSEQYIADLIKKYERNHGREGLKDTPARVMRAYDELLTPVDFEFTCFDSNGYNQMIVDKGIEYYTLCEHHLLPFFGTVKIGYIPHTKIAGLSKLARCVEFFSRRLNTQEYFTQNIADFLFEALQAKGVGVIVSGRHLCAEMRGVKKRNEMITSCLRGQFLTEAGVKEEFIKL